MFIGVVQSTCFGYSVAVVRDGPSTYFDELHRIFEIEIKLLNSGKTEPVLKEIEATPYDIESIREALSTALSSDEYDAVYTCGIIATELAQEIARTDGKLLKPVIAGSLQLNEIETDLVSQQGTSEIENYSLIVTPKRVSTDLERLSGITGHAEIQVVIDEIYIKALESRIQKGEQQFADTIGVSVQLVPASANVEETLSRISAESSAVYVSILDRFDDDYLSSLYEGLKDRRLPSMAMRGRQDVEKGALLSLAQFNLNQIARRAALNLHLMISGTPASRLPVYLPSQDRLFLNMETARAINWAPNYDTVLAAETINAGRSTAEAPITIEKAMQRARANNVNVDIAVRTVDISESNVDIARSSLLPQVSGSGSANENRFYGQPSSSIDSSSSASLGIQLRQILFNEEVWSGIRIQKDLLAASKMDLLSTELDTLGLAASAYLSCLSAEALYNIERENLNLTYNNVQLARLRVEIGAAQASELFRWEQQLARGKAVLIQRESARLNAIVQFNRVLGMPQTSTWSFVDIEVGDDELYFLNKSLSPLINNTRDFENFVYFAVSKAIQNSPELGAFDLQLQVQGIQLRSLKRDFYLPEVSLSGQFGRNYSKNNVSDWSGQNQASLGMQVTIPIFEGGGRFDQIRQQRDTIARLESQRLATVQSLEESTLSATNAIRSGHPNIRLNREALKAAQSNYDSVNVRYAQGDTSYLDILDAQQALLSQKQSLATATYDYLAAIYRLQRSMAWFEYDKSESERSNWIQEFQNFKTTQP